MPLRQKTALIIGAAICGLLLLMFLFARLIMLAGFERLEQDSAHRNLERIVNALDAEIDHLEKTTTDWAYWDDTYISCEISMKPTKSPISRTEPSKPSILV